MTYQTYLQNCQCTDRGTILIDGQICCRMCRTKWMEAAMIDWPNVNKGQALTLKLINVPEEFWNRLKSELPKDLKEILAGHVLVPTTVVDFNIYKTLSAEDLMSELIGRFLGAQIANIVMKTHSIYDAARIMAKIKDKYGDKT